MPSATIINGVVDVDAADGSPQNDAKNFTLQDGEQVDLGQWRIDGGNNIFKINAITDPVRANTEVVIELEAGF